MERDFTHVSIINPNDTTLVYGPLSKFIFDWRHKMYGIDVRESGGRAFESISIQLNQFNASLNKQSHLFDSLHNQLDESINGLTQDSEVKQARVTSDGKIYVNLKGRLDSLETSKVSFFKTDNSVFLKNGSLYIDGLDSESSPIDSVLVGQIEDKNQSYGAEVINAKDLEFEEV